MCRNGKMESSGRTQKRISFVCYGKEVPGSSSRGISVLCTDTVEPWTTHSQLGRQWDCARRGEASSLELGSWHKLIPFSAVSVDTYACGSRPELLPEAAVRFSTEPLIGLQSVSKQQGPDMGRVSKAGTVPPLEEARDGLCVPARTF